MNEKIVSRLLASMLFGGVLATGCLPSDGAPDQPGAGLTLARVTVGEPRPNLMLLVDTSHSMTEPADPSLDVCKRNGVVCGDNTFQCPISSGCDTRWSALQKAMTNFLGENGTAARLGLATFPADDFCGPSVFVSVPLPDAYQEDDATLTSNANSVLSKLLAIKTYRSASTDKVPEGGTPTAESLKYLGDAQRVPQLQTADRSDFVLLLTDGLPNCNSGHSTASTQCYCTLSVGCTNIPEGCLDDTASVSAVKQLATQEIKTIVIGFGADFNATNESGRRGAATLNVMAEAGGFARTCKVDSDCGTGDACDTARGLCNRRFYQAANKMDLSAALQAIADRLKASCVFRLDSGGAYTQESLDVSLDGKVLAPGVDTWTLTSEGVRFTGSACQRLQAATRAAPVLVEVIKAR